MRTNARVVLTSLAEDEIYQDQPPRRGSPPSGITLLENKAQRSSAQVTSRSYRAVQCESGQVSGCGASLNGTTSHVVHNVTDIERKALRYCLRHACSNYLACKLVCRCKLLRNCPSCAVPRAQRLLPASKELHTNAPREDATNSPRAYGFRVMREIPSRRKTRCCCGSQNKANSIKWRQARKMTMKKHRHKYG